MVDLSDDELQREFSRRKRINSYGYIVVLAVVLLSYPIAWASGAHGGRLTQVALGISLPCVLVYLIAKSAIWRCPACGFRFSWARSRIADYYGSGASCDGCKRRLAA